MDVQQLDREELESWGESVKKRTEQVLQRSKRPSLEEKWMGKRNELQVPTCLMNMPARGIQRWEKGGWSPDEGEMTKEWKGITLWASGYIRRFKATGGEGRRERRGKGPC